MSVKKYNLSTYLSKWIVLKTILVQQQISYQDAMTGHRFDMAYQISERKISAHVETLTKFKKKNVNLAHTCYWSEFFCWQKQEPKYTKEVSLYLLSVLNTYMFNFWWDHIIIISLYFLYVLNVT